VAPDVQAMLIKVIESREYRSLGSEEVRRCNVNFLFAGNRDLKGLVRAGQIRQDFYFRVLEVLEVPPLRERREDIPYFINRFLQESNRRQHKYVSVSAAAIARIEAYDWPGNVRQLKNVMERAVLHCRGFEITEDDLRLDDPRIYDLDSGPVSRGAAVASATAPPTVGNEDFLDDLRSLVSRHIALKSEDIRLKKPKSRDVFVDFDAYRGMLPQMVLEATGGNKKATAQLLGLSIEQLATLLKNSGK
jgi:DNA-binding NtrC family response regulator